MEVSVGSGTKSAHDASHIGSQVEALPGCVQVKVGFGRRTSLETESQAQDPQMPSRQDLRAPVRNR